MMDESTLMPTTNMTTSPPTIPQPKKNQILRCPRCDSANTKFCYYNNYSLSQPRHFCKACKRYWTRGGTLRNVPVGGGCRKNKRVIKKSPASASASATVSTDDPARSFNLDNFNSFLPAAANHATNFASYSLPPCDLGGIDTNDQFQLGFDDYPSSLLTYQNLQNYPSEVKVERESNVVDPWQVSNNFVMNPFEALAGSVDSSYPYWNSAVMGSAAAWPDVTNSSMAPLI